MGAYKFTAQWSIYLGLPGLPGHIGYDFTEKKYVVFTPGIEKTIEMYPSLSAEEQVVGKTAKGCTEVEKKDVGK